MCIAACFWGFLRTPFLYRLPFAEFSAELCIVGAVAKKGGKISTSTEDEVRAGISDLILGQGPKAPTYGRVFSQAPSLRFYTQYQEYERSVELCNSGQPI